MNSSSMNPLQQRAACILSLITIFRMTAVAAVVPCTNTAQCEAILRPGSECSIDGFCDNPFRKGGCLKQAIPNWDKIRICNSEDSLETEALGYCQHAENGLDFLEIRIAGQNWMSAYLQAWILQIMLSEVLDVPATIETGTPDAKLSFYEPDNRLDYTGVAYPWDALRTARQVGDCRTIQQDTDGEYRPCAHVIPEVWHSERYFVNLLQEQGVAERPKSVGLIGQQGLYIPRFTGDRDPSLVSYLGLAGEENRKKLAEMFKRPTTWKDYCDAFSPNHCASPDGVAQRAPRTDSEEESRMFAEGLYTGYFRATEENDCEEHPTTCTGHVVDFPCGWNSYVPQQFHHLNIAMESNGDEPGARGYAYTQMKEIWLAANATKSNVMMMWWTPEAMHQDFVGEEAEFLRVTLPPTNQECVAARVNPQTRCSLVEHDRFGSDAGTCDEPPDSLTRLIVSNLEMNTHDEAIPSEMHSPASDMIKDLTISDTQISQLYDYVSKRDLDPRDAACRYVSENIEEFMMMIPDTYPRTIKEDPDIYKDPLFFVSLAVAFLSICMVLFVIVGAYKNRDKPTIAYTQIEFLWLLQAGMLMVSVSSFILVAPPSLATCSTVVWLSNVGYTLELVPLLVKVAAINRLVTAAQRMKRIVLKRRSLFGLSFGFSFLIIVYLTIWQVMDPPTSKTHYQLIDKQTQNGETVVMMNYYCHSEKDVWMIISTGWHSILLICATVLAFQTRNVRSSINESRTMCVLVYSHFVFVVQRLILLALEDSLETSIVARYQSLIFSIDTIATCCIYFIPKLMLNESRDSSSSSRLSPFARMISRKCFGEPSLHGHPFRDKNPVRRNDVAVSTETFSGGLSVISETTPSTLKTSDEGSLPTISEAPPRQNPGDTAWSNTPLYTGSSDDGDANNGADV